MLRLENESSFIEIIGIISFKETANVIRNADFINNPLVQCYATVGFINMNKDKA